MIRLTGASLASQSTLYLNIYSFLIIIMMNGMPAPLAFADGQDKRTVPFPKTLKSGLVPKDRGCTSIRAYRFLIT